MRFLYSVTNEGICQFVPLVPFKIAPKSQLAPSPGRTMTGLRGSGVGSGVGDGVGVGVGVGEGVGLGVGVETGNGYIS